jgi:DUF4097 and DUF4098 domain-containing protein YvlB
MNILKYVLIVPLIGISFISMAKEAVDQQLSVTDNPSVSVKIQRGNVELISWDKNSIQIKGELDELSQGLLFEVKGNTVIVEDKLPRSYQGSNEQGSKLTIYLPKQLGLDAQGVSASYQLSQLNGQITLALVSGNINAQQLSGNTKLTTVSGNINTSELAGKINLETVSGDITDNNSQGEAELRLVSGELKSQSAFTLLTVDQVSGDISATVNQVTELSVVTISGDAQLTIGADLNKAQLESISGDMALTFTAMPNISFMIDGGPGGKIDNQLTDDKPLKQKYSPAKTLQFKTQAGTGQVNINTISGKISLTK